MKRILAVTCLLLTFVATPVLAHHAAQSVVDEEIYTMIDSMVADTPHAEMTLDDIAVGMTEMVIDTQNVRSLELMIDDGLLTYLDMLDGDVSITIEMNDDNSVTMTVLQVE